MNGSGEGGLCPDGSAPRDTDADRELREYLLGSHNGSRHPPEVYDIGCDEGGWSAFLRKLWCGVQAFPFAAGKWAVATGAAIVVWALEFRIADSLTPVADVLARVYDVSLVGSLGVRHLAWTVAAVVGGWHVLRARTSRAAAEIASTFAIAAVATFVVANPGGYLQGAVDLARNSTAAVLEAVGGTVHGDAQGDSTALLEDMMHEAFVAQPYDHINWGRQLDGACADARDDILANGPWGSDGEPRETMRAAGCDDEADFNERPSDTRAVTSIVVAAAAIVTAVLMVLVALGVVMAQLTVVFLFTVTSVVFAVAMFPGAARNALWWWLRRVAWSVLTAVAAAFLLSWVAVTVTALLTVSDDMPMTHRGLLVLLVTVFAWRIRGQLNRVTDGLSRRLGDRAGGIAPSAGSLPLAAAGAGGLRSMTRELAADLPGGQWATYRLDARRFGRGRYRGGSFGGLGRRGAIRRRAGGQARGMLAATKGEVRATGRALRGVALAPVTAPQAYAAGHRRVTDASRRARSRLAQAQDTRRQWVHNATHPAQTMRAAHQRARRQAAAQDRRTNATNQRRRPRPPQPPRRTDPETLDWM